MHNTVSREFRVREDSRMEIIIARHDFRRTGDEQFPADSDDRAYSASHEFRGEGVHESDKSSGGLSSSGERSTEIFVFIQIWIHEERRDECHDAAYAESYR